MAWLEEAAKTLGRDDPFVKAALGDSDAAEVVRRAVRETQLTRTRARKSPKRVSPFTAKRLRPTRISICASATAKSKATRKTQLWCRSRRRFSVCMTALKVSANDRRMICLLGLKKGATVWICQRR
jgi:hypothetical protein